MLSLIKDVNRFFLICFVMITVSLNVLCDGSVLAQENSIGVFVENMTIDKETKKIDICKYCGRLMKVGNIHSDADKIMGNQVGVELDYRKIQYVWGRENNKYLHVYIYRFEERKGGNFAVEKPAGVGFHMHVIEDNSVKRTFVFDEDQRPLSENVLNIGQFFKRGGKWITMDVLSQEGIEKGLNLLADDLK